MMGDCEICKEMEAGPRKLELTLDPRDGSPIMQRKMRVCPPCVETLFFAEDEEYEYCEE